MGSMGSMGSMGLAGVPGSPVGFVQPDSLSVKEASPYAKGVCIHFLQKVTFQRSSPRKRR